MPLTFHYRANARIVAHGLNVYPLQGFGLLLGQASPDGHNDKVLAALPIGNTKHRHTSQGRFAPAAPWGGCVWPGKRAS